MSIARFHLAELSLAVLFLGLFAGLVARTWSGSFFVHGIVVTSAVLLPVYLLLIIMIRQHREQNRRPDS